MTTRPSLVALAAATAVTLSACASSSSSPTPVPDQPTRVSTGLTTTGSSSLGAANGALDYYRDEGFISIEVPSASAEFLWPSLLQTYEDLEISLGKIDTDAYILGNTDFQFTRRLSGIRASRMFRCGSTMTGPLADAARISLDIETRITEVEGGSVVSTLVRGAAAPFDGGGALRPCTSTGVLEEAVHEGLLKRLVTGS